MTHEKSPSTLLRRQQRLTTFLKYAREVGETDPNRGVRFVAKTAIFFAELAQAHAHDQLLDYTYTHDDQAAVAHRNHGEFSEGLPVEDMDFRQFTQGQSPEA